MLSPRRVIIGTHKYRVLVLSVSSNRIVSIAAQGYEYIPSDEKMSYTARDIYRSLSAYDVLVGITGIHDVQRASGERVRRGRSHKETIAAKQSRYDEAPASIRGYGPEFTKENTKCAEYYRGRPPLSIRGKGRAAVHRTGARYGQQPGLKAL